jgi:Adenosine-deaminase (editase) domain
MTDAANASVTAKQSATPLSLSDRIAECALEHYHQRLKGNKGKPKRNEEWTVYAAMIAHRIDDDRSMWIVSCATGTKCTAQRQNGTVLHDSHAEVLARRGLVRVLWKEIQQRRNDQMQNHNEAADPRFLLVRRDDSTPDECTTEQSTQPKYQLHPQIQLHLYISDSPCGDASIYPVSAISQDDAGNDQQQDSGSLLYTGAKIVVSEATGVTSSDCGGQHQLLPTPALQKTSLNQHKTKTDTKTSSILVAREVAQVLGKLRTKSGRSNLPDHLRSTSMSCSDKIALWSILGLQGGLLSNRHSLNPPIIPLTSVVVSRDPRATTCNDIGSQQVALERAISLRVQQAQQLLKTLNQKWDYPPVPSVHVVSAILSSGKAAMSNNDNLNHSSTHCMQSGQKRKRENHDCDSKRTIPPCGIALNWNQADGDLELLVGARGIRQGKKPKSQLDYQKLSSRLCRANLLQLANLLLPISDLVSGTDTVCYQDLKVKLATNEYRDTKNLLFLEKSSPFAGWVRGGDEEISILGENN